MARAKSETLATILWRAAGEVDLAQLGDAELIDRYVACGDERAFRVLVGRHSPLVWDVCARLLRSHQDAEDAFQATFIALARRARAGDRFQSLPAWLREVARRAARDVRLSASRRREVSVESMTDTPARPLTNPQELSSVLDEEVARLPESLREPFVLCRFENRTYAEAAEMLGCSVATICRRVEQAASGLRDRLMQRGLMPTGGVAGVVLASSTSAMAVPPGLAVKAADMAMAVCSGATAPASLVATADAALRTGSLASLKVAVLAVTVVLVGIGGATLILSGEPELPATKPAGPTPVRGGPGAPLPQGALVQIRPGRPATHDPLAVDGVAGLAFSADGKTLATITPTKTPVRLWNVATGAALDSVMTPENVRVQGVQPAGPGFAVLCAEPAATVPAQWILWDAGSGSRAMAMIPETDRLQTSAMSPDGRMMAVARGENVVLLKPTTGEVLETLEGAPAAVESLMFTADGNALMVHGRGPGGDFIVWLRAKGRWERPKSGPWLTPFRSGRVLATSPDGRYAVVPCDNAYADPILVHDLHRNGSVVGWLEVGGGPFALAFSPDSRMLAATNEGATVRVWEVASGKLRREFPGHGAKILSVGFSPDSTRLASGSADGTALVWDLTVPSKITEGTVEELVSRLTGPDAVAAHDAGLTLARQPDAAVRSLEPYLLTPKPTEAEIDRWLTALELPDSPRRRAAVIALEAHGRSVEAPIRQAAADNPPETSRLELYRLSERLDGARSPRRWLEVRALEILERAGTTDARRVLAAMVERYPDTLGARDAAAALRRLDTRTR